MSGKTVIFAMKNFLEAWNREEEQPHNMTYESHDKRWLGQLMLKHADTIMDALMTARGVSFTIDTLVAESHDEWIQTVKEQGAGLQRILSKLDEPFCEFDVH